MKLTRLWSRCAAMGKVIPPCAAMSMGCIMLCTVLATMKTNMLETAIRLAHHVGYAAACRCALPSFPPHFRCSAAAQINTRFSAPIISPAGLGGTPETVERMDPEEGRPEPGSIEETEGKGAAISSHASASAIDPTVGRDSPVRFQDVSPEHPSRFADRVHSFAADSRVSATSSGKRHSSLVGSLSPFDFVNMYRMFPTRMDDSNEPRKSTQRWVSYDVPGIGPLTTVNPSYTKPIPGVAPIPFPPRFTRKSSHKRKFGVPQLVGSESSMAQSPEPAPRTMSIQVGSPSMCGAAAILG